MTPDTTTSTPDAAGRHARAGASESGPTRVERLKEAVDPQANPVGELTHHHHRPDVACLACALQASLERLNGTCERCCVVLTDEQCTHGLGLCGKCLHYCPNCVADIEYDEAEDVGRWSE